MRLLPLLALLLATPPLAAVTPQQAIAELQRSLDAPLRDAAQPAPGLAAQMRALRVPGLSIAVLHQGKLHWAQGFGEASAGVPVTPATRFQAASISKPVTAIAALARADELGLSWDADLRPQLGGWVPAQDDGAPRYTLRHLLTHTAGLGVHGFPGYAPGEPRPTLTQVLDGVAPANTPAVIPVQPPGRFRYSGGGTSIVQRWIEAHSGPSFEAFMQQRLLQPLGLRDSHFNQPPTDAGPYAQAHQQGQALPGGWRIHPELAAAGLWTTPSDLARLALAVQAARAGTASGPLTPALARALTTPGAVPHWGIGFALEGEPGRLHRFGHGGVNAGFVSQMQASLEGGYGVVVMANGAEAHPLLEGVKRTLARVYRWPGGLQAPLLARSQALPAGAARWVGDYPAPGASAVDAPPLRIRQHQGALWWARAPGDWVRLHRLVDGRFSTNGQHLFHFATGSLQLDGQRLRQSPAQPLRWPTLYARGGFNDWGTSAPLLAVGAGRWQGELSLPSGKSELKLADAKWQSVDFGAAGPDPLQPGRWTELRGRGGNLLLDLPPARRWLLELEAADTAAPARMRLTALP